MCMGTIRPAIDHDLQEIERIVEEAYAPYIARIGRKPAPMTEDYAALVGGGTLWVLAADDILGLIDLRMAPDHMLINNLAVGRAYQGQGHGRRLLDHADTRARQAGKSELRLYTNALMHENLRIYRRLGWDEYKRAEEDGFQRVFMRKHLP